MTDFLARLKAALAERYRIERELGAGGMATVYLAEDLKHHRKVAVKVFHPELAALIGAERFLAEIRTTANLQHPHILPLHDSGQADVFLFYVMPYVEGETLRARLNQEKQLPVEEALRITREVAAALDYAHRHGVIHRDIKPENILLHEGQALVADFGIALAVSSAGRERMTQTGMSLGTPEYMSPEQALGERNITAKSDVYALGCVLYEMLTGEPPFTGATVQAVVAKVMNDRPTPPSVTRDTVPPQVETAVLRALARLPADRFESAAEFAGALANPHFLPAVPSSAGPPLRRAQRRRLLLLGFALVAVLAAAALGSGLGARSRESRAAVQFIPIALEDPPRLRTAFTATARLSPDGQRILYLGRDGRYHLLDLRSGRVHPLAPSAPPGLSLSYSPEGDRVVFRSVSWSGQLFVVSTGSGQWRILTDSALSIDPAWGDDGWIYYQDMSGGISRVRPDGTGKGVVIGRTQQDDWMSGALEALPGSRGVLYTSRPFMSGDPALAEIVALDFESGQRRVVTRGVQARFCCGGFLLVVQADGSLLAAPFDVKSLTARGAFVRVLDSVEVRAGFNIGSNISVAENGDLLYVTQVPVTSDSLLLVRRGGQIERAIGGWPGWINELTGNRGVSAAMSKDGRSVVAAVHQGLSAPNLWVRPLAGTQPQRLTFGPVLDLNPTFIRNDREIAFISPRGGKNWDLYAVPLEGERDLAVMLDRPGDIMQPVFTSDDRWVAFCERGLKGEVDLFAHRFAPDTLSVVLAATPYTECSPAIAPGARWLAYVSDESGRNEVYVVPFPDAAKARWQISMSGATAPGWSRDGRELYYRAADGNLMAVPVATGTTFSFGTPTPVLYEGRMIWTRATTPDGRSFVMLDRDVRAPGRLILVRNWRAELHARLKKSADN